MDKMAEQRNAIIASRGGGQLDSTPYDATITANAASQALREIRRDASKRSTEFAEPHTSTLGTESECSGSEDLHAASEKGATSVAGATMTKNNNADNLEEAKLLNFSSETRAREEDSSEASAGNDLEMTVSTQSMVEQRLQAFGTRWSDHSIGDVCNDWDEFKKALRSELIDLKKQARRRMTNGFR
ncbi:hypothetical protein PRIC2_007446 [Phytophthora ramorum]